MSKIFNILFRKRLTFFTFTILMLNQFLQLFNSNLVQFEFFFFLFKNQQFFLFLQSPLMQLMFNILYFLLPHFLRLLPFFFELVYLILNISNHISSHNVCTLPFLSFFLTLFNSHLHLLYFGLFCYVLLMIFP